MQSYSRINSNLHQGFHRILKYQSQNIDFEIVFFTFQANFLSRHLLNCHFLSIFRILPILIFLVEMMMVLLPVLKVVFINCVFQLTIKPGSTSTFTISIIGFVVIILKFFHLVFSTLQFQIKIVPFIPFFVNDVMWVIR